MSRNIAVVISIFIWLGNGASADTISWGTTISGPLLRLDGSAIDSTFEYQVGRFDTDFDPLVSNISLWAASWHGFDEANTANAGLNTAVGFVSRSPILEAGGTTSVPLFSAAGFNFLSPGGNPQPAYIWNPNSSLHCGSRALNNTSLLLWRIVATCFSTAKLCVPLEAEWALPTVSKRSN